MPGPAPPPLWTVGHSTRTAEEFVHVLQTHRIEVVADVRRFPGSRRHPHFGTEALARQLEADGIGYTWIANLGGRRRGETGPQQMGWRNPSFRAYAAYTWTDAFAQGLEELLHIASAQRTAVMCSELLWWRCHRALIADVMLFLGAEVSHILSAEQAKAHPYTSPARVLDGELAYPASCC